MTEQTVVGQWATRRLSRLRKPVILPVPGGILTYRVGLFERRKVALRRALLLQRLLRDEDLVRLSRSGNWGYRHAR